LRSADKNICVNWWIFVFIFIIIAFAPNTVFAEEDPIKNQSGFQLSDTVPNLRIPYQSKFFEPFNYRFTSPIFLRTPPNIKSQIVYDPQNRKYNFFSRMGNLNYRQPYQLNFDEYQDYALKKSVNDYFRDRRNTSGSDSRAGIIPSVHVGGEAFDRIFGGNTIDIRPQGSAELTFGVLANNRKDETLDVRRRRTTNFDFKEKIQMSVLANIGDKIQFKTNYNTESTFDFENKLALKYEGKEDEIVKLIEAGDVTLPLPTTLITGSQSLFGIKTKLQFGRTTITSVFSQQKSQTSSITVQGGAQTNEFSLTAVDYEENRHFFIGQYFREDLTDNEGKQSNRYNEALKNLPVITSNINITRMEVWVTNIGPAVSDNRNIIALSDLGEFNPDNRYINPKTGGHLPSNLSNDLLNRLDTAQLRDINTVSNYLKYDPLNLGQSGYFIAGEDFEKIESARKLRSSEYTFNKRLGFISLNTTLNPDQTLAVAYQYTVIGDNKIYQVGEFTDQGINAPQVLIVKMLKSTSVNTHRKMWDLMMKNVYSIRAYQINPEDFIFNIFYSGNKNGIPTAYLTEGDDNIKGIPLIRLMNMDNLSPQLNPPPDGIFDFIDGAATDGGTIQASNGRIFFPVLEPFGKDLRKLFTDPALASKYAYDSLYTLTKTGAEQYPQKNKFILEGIYKSSSSNEISLNALNVPQGSVVVSAGGIPLTENVDYTVDYTLGRVRIINEGILNSGTPIKVSLESNSMFNLQTKRMMGTHINYALKDNTNIGATIINLNERPLTQKTNYGDDPISNTIWGINFNFEEESRLLTKLVDKLPFISTKEKSVINIDGEFAHFIPGHSKAIGKTGTSYIDDFEGSKSTLDLKNFGAWLLASTPQGQYDEFPESAPNEGLNYGKNRAKMAWYIIDPLFYDRKTTLKPPNIDNNELSKNSVRQVLETEIFPNKDIPNGIPTNIPILNMAFYPAEKGPYNFDVTPVGNLTAGINETGALNDPESRWGGVMRKIESTDFEATNVEYIEFWLMDPFSEDATNSGKLYFNLGDISEDILRDSRKSFENGLPSTEEVVNVDTTIWGRVPTLQSLVESFDNQAGTRRYQDVGYDGLGDDDEQSFFNEISGKHDYLNKIQNIFGTNSVAFINANRDPSSDNYHYFRGSDYDDDNRYASILERYKNFNNPDGNSPSSDQNPEPYPTAATAMPDGEDINYDNTLSEAERYFQYEIELDKQKMLIGQNYITDIYEATSHQLPNGNLRNTKWYQFKIPVNQPDKIVGNIQDFKSIRFLRMFMKGFKRPVVLRFATLELVRGEWRRYNQSLMEGVDISQPIDLESQTTFDVSAVNIEENGKRYPVPYVIPPGIEREINIATTDIIRRNEQAMVMKVDNLEDGDSRGVYKTTDFDFRQYKNLQMFVHAEKMYEAKELQSGELSVFMRFGSDFSENYYEYEIPLQFTPWGTTAADPYAIWPEDNSFSIDLERLVEIKQQRNIAMRDPASGLSNSVPYIIYDGNAKVTVIGMPSISDVKAILIGIRNPKSVNSAAGDDGMPKSAEIWVNEMRLTDFSNNGGWAATARISANLADLGRVTLMGSHNTPGFGSIEQRVNETFMEAITSIDFSTDMEIGKFFPEKSGIRIPFHFDYSEAQSTPQYNPLDPDIELKKELDSFETQEERDSLNRIVVDYVQRKNINFMNVRKDKLNGEKARVYDIENLNFSYAYSEIFSRNIDVDYDLKKVYRGGFGYNFTNNPKLVKPFGKSEFLSGSKYLNLIRDFNFYYLPKLISFRTDMYREHNKRTLRNKSSGDVPMETFYVKKWDWNRNYNVKFDLSQSLKLDFRANATAYIDEPQGNPEKGDEEYSAYRREIFDEIGRLGSINRYNQLLILNYALPFQKMPLLDWISSQLSYQGTFNWGASPSSIQQQFGNQIENSAQLQLTGDFNLSKLYDKIPYFKSINQPQRVVQSRNQPSTNQNLQDEVVRGEEEKHQKDRPNYFKVAADNLLRLLMAVKRASVNYSEIRGTFIPGFYPEPTSFGNSWKYTPDEDLYSRYPNFENNYPSSLAPGIGFVFGDQRDIRNDAVRYGWLSPDTLLNQQYATKLTSNLTMRATIEPLSGLKIELNADRAYAVSHSEYFRADANGNFHSYAPIDNGSFSMSIIAWKSAFKKESSENISENFKNFKNYREIIAYRLANENPNYSGQTFVADTINGDLVRFPVGYGPSSQDVLLYSLLAAYTGKNPEDIALTKFPKIPIPNWRITFTGLTKIEALQKIFRNITLMHAYRASYNVGSFVSNVGREMINGFPASLNVDGINFIPEYDIAQVSITEQFAPLISIDVIMQNSLTSKVEIKKSRNLAFSFANNQLIEVKSDELVVGIGYRIKDVSFMVKSATGGNSSRRMSSDLNLKADFSIRNNKTTLRRINEGINQISAGQKVVSINTSADYMVNQKFNIRFFFDKVINNPFVSTQYPNSTTNGGISLRFILN